MIEGNWLHQALHGVKQKLRSKTRIQILPHHPAPLSFRQQTAEDIGYIAAPHGQNQLMQFRGESLEQGPS